MSETRSAPPRQSRPAPEAGRDWHDRLEDLRRETSHLLDVMYEKIGREHQAVSGRVGRNFPPPSDLGTTETGFELAVELPGVDEADIEVLVSGDLLTVEGEKRLDRPGALLRPVQPILRTAARLGRRAGQGELRKRRPDRARPVEARREAARKANLDRVALSAFRLLGIGAARGRVRRQGRVSLPAGRGWFATPGRFRSSGQYLYGGPAFPMVLL
jgi:hypothetical protein